MQSELRPNATSSFVYFIMLHRAFPRFFPSNFEGIVNVSLIESQPFRFACKFHTALTRAWRLQHFRIHPRKTATVQASIHTLHAAFFAWAAISRVPIKKAVAKRQMQQQRKPRATAACAFLLEFGAKPKRSHFYAAGLL